MYSDDIAYICFRESERKRWYLKLLKAGFSHCFVLICDRGHWIKYESGDGVARVDIVLNFDEYTKGCIIVSINTSPQKTNIMINSCVGFVKFITGIKGLSLTPYQLYKRLKSWDY